MEVSNTTCQHLEGTVDRAVEESFESLPINLVWIYVQDRWKVAEGKKRRANKTGDASSADALGSHRSPTDKEGI
jgi:hypothetical protein